MNEGVRISAIVRDLRQRFSRLTEAGRGLLRASLQDPPPGEFGTRKIVVRNTGPQMIRIEDGSPMDSGSPLRDPETQSSPAFAEAGGLPASRIDRDYSNRRGYNPLFLPQFALPMPQLTNQQQQQAARVSGMGMQGNPFELKYQHFSVVMNAQRRLPFFAICNIDGSRKIRMSRDGKISRGPESAEGAEATESWATDPRIPPEAQLDDSFYQWLRQRLRGAGNDFFARGHMCRREDPIWGNAEVGLRANDDTFHHTNGCPQLQNAFNGSSRVWLGLENYVLNAADDTNLRVTVITGPVLTKDDYEVSDSRLGRFLIPKQYWKIAVRVEDGTPHVVALLADQSEGLATLRETGREATFDWPARLSREYISTVSRIEELTGLNFGDLSLHDDFAKDGPERLTELIDPVQLFPSSAQGLGSFGTFPNMSQFLSAWDAHVRELGTKAKAEGRRRPERGRPVPRHRKIVEVESEVSILFDDDLSGSKHQLFEVRLTKWLAGDARAKSDVESTIQSSELVRVSVRYGDSAGLPERIREIRRSVKLHLKGEWISAAEASAIGGRRMAVLHFTHEPLGFICTPVQCYD
jgi:endonuclease G